MKQLPLQVSVVIPTRNEEGSIAKVIHDCDTALRDVSHEVIIVDASQDDTSSEARKAGAKVVTQRGKGGVGEALTQGFRLANGEYVVFLDGDGTYNPEDLHRLIEPLVKGEADLVNGNRFAGMEDGAMPLTNRIGNRILTWVGNKVFDTKVKDSQSGMKGFRRNLLTRMTLWERGFPICSELLAEASKLNLQIVEVGISYRRRIGESKLKPASEGPRILWASLMMLRDYNPLLLFGGLGLAAMTIGLLVVLPVIYEFLAYRTFRLTGRALIALLCWLAGLLCIFSGVILDTVNYSIRRLEYRMT